MKDLIVTNNALLNEGLTIRRCVRHVTPFEETTFVPNNLCIRSYDPAEHENGIILHLLQRRTPDVWLNKARARPIRQDLAGNLKITRVKHG